MSPKTQPPPTKPHLHPSTLPKYHILRIKPFPNGILLAHSRSWHSKQYIYLMFITYKMFYLIYMHIHLWNSQHLLLIRSSNKSGASKSSIVTTDYVFFKLKARQVVNLFLRTTLKRTNNFDYYRQVPCTVKITL